MRYLILTLGAVVTTCLLVVVPPGPPPAVSADVEAEGSFARHVVTKIEALARRNS